MPFRNTLFFALLLSLFASSPCFADTGLTIAVGGNTRTISADELLRGAREVTVPKDAAYGHAMAYRAVPLAELLKGALAPDQVLQAVATDGFTAALPSGLVQRKPSDGRAVAYLAIEPPGNPWPKLAGKEASAGPFYIIWLHPEKDGIKPEQWPYGVVKLASADSPARRWPAIAVRSNAKPAARRGQDLFVTNCMVCHRMNGAGDAEVGPDLNLPKNPVEYFKKDALHAYIRDPAALRSWKAMGMKGFGKDALSDRDIDDIIAYLDDMAAHKRR